ncbi:BppU family phage baseplate upper protein [Listeria monocytogenes]|nr:BppU family phage baseplate upper protein [Listeria monocytogenes]HEL6873717.1 BppU family phage baseplate upper protein [Listeria monocytogenes]HEL6949000.1 BppU family phage baseplate upper protein [Listeria monocytogenes]HEL6993569.1 BppU family phage baseplate upper protein [Listeria monocytogenes]HEL7054241.1 BppU family phage baseplate upper protein [Listeria monocytogenes]
MSALRKINATLDLNKKTWNMERIEAIQSDINSLTLAVQIVESGLQKDLTGYKPTFAVVLPGTNEYILDDLHVNLTNLSEGYFEYTFVKEAFAVPGIYDTARFIIKKDDGTELTGMPRFMYYVEKDPLQGTVKAETYVSDFERLESMIADVETEIADLHDEVTSESLRLDTEIAQLDTKIDTETGKLQTEANNLQTQFDSLNPDQFPQKADFENHINNTNIHVTMTDKTNWNTKENTAGSQAKADSALNSAKAYTDSKMDSYGAWINVPLASGYSTGDSNTPQYRLVAKQTSTGLKTFAEFRGSVAGTFISTANSTLATMPTGTRPIVTYYGAATSNNGNGGRIAIPVDGKLLQVSSTDNANPSYVSLSMILYEVGN